MLMENINGILLPGGDASLWVDEETTTGFSELTLAGERLFEKAMELNDKGIHFPIWATCMSYEMILLFMTGDDGFLDRFNSTNHSLNT